MLIYTKYKYVAQTGFAQIISFLFRQKSSADFCDDITLPTAVRNQDNLIKQV